MSRRDEIAAALSAIPGITGYAYRQTSSLKPGYAWVQWSGDERDEHWFYTTWTVMVYAANNVAQADKWIDENKQALIEGLESSDAGYVDKLEPALIGDREFGLLITLRSE